AIFQIAAVEDRAALFINRFQLDPDVEGVNGAAGEEVADFAGAHDEVEPDRFAALDDGVHFIERRDDFDRRRDERLLGAEIHALFADRKGAGELRLFSAGVLLDLLRRGR